MPIVSSLLDSDWYKLLMGQVVLFRFPDLWVRYKFINRGNTWFPEGFDIKLKEEINYLATLTLTYKEKLWLLKQKGMNKYYG
jgi:nicotinate phosphoribosyltransferase